MRHHDLHRRTIQVIEIPFQPLHVISHHHLGEIIAHDHIPIMFLRRVLTDPSPAEQLLEPIGLGAVIVTRQVEISKLLPKRRGRRKQERYNLPSSG